VDEDGADRGAEGHDRGRQTQPSDAAAGRQGLEAGDVFCQDSVRFRSFEDDLVDDRQWKDKERLIAETGLSLLRQPIREQLAELEEQLESRITEVNGRIATRENEHFEFIRHGRHVRWTLRYPHESEWLNHPFFDRLKQRGSAASYIL
jgi:hypothetical protein